jgi:hypothetical protein
MGAPKAGTLLTGEPLKADRATGATVIATLFRAATVEAILLDEKVIQLILGQISNVFEVV